MSLISAAVHGSTGSYEIANSIRLDGSNDYLTRTFSATPYTYTLSVWVKRGALGVEQIIAGSRWVSGVSGLLEFQANDTIRFVANGATVCTTTAVYRDPAAHLNVVLRVSPSGTAYIYVNGAQVASGATTATPWLFNSAANYVNTIGRMGDASLLYFDGYLSEINFIDGQALDPSYFGYTDATTGQWRPKKYTGTYGTDGFYLDFKDGSSTTTLGYDRSGNGNNWTLTNMVRSAGVTDCWMTDTPTNNYATLNPLDLYIGSTGYSNGNLTRSATPSGGYSTIGVSTGKWYWEWVNTTIGSVRPVAGIRSFGSVDQYLTYNSNGDKNINGTVTAYGASYAVNDTLGVEVDLDGGTVTFYKNGVSQGAISYAFNGLTFRAFWGTYTTQGADVLHVNFGQRSFAYTPPTGYKALCTANLPTPTGAAAEPKKHFDAKTRTGTGAVSNITGINFQPDLVWTKDRGAAKFHGLVNSVVGATKFMFSNSTSQELTYADSLTSFNSNGFSLGADVASGGFVNEAAHTYVDCLWKAGGAPVTNNAGTISSQVSANTLAGFSIVTYTGNNTSGTVGHGLGVAPKLVIVKDRTGGTNGWATWHSSLAGTEYLFLNTTAAKATLASVWNSTAPTSSVFSIGPASAVNVGANNYVAYCFAEVPGFSKAFTYTGTGTADGPFVWCGFKPRWIIIKKTSATGNWIIYDTVRKTFNTNDVILQANASAAEISAAENIDILCNGFKPKYAGAGDTNTSGATYVGFAIAEAPFQYSNAF